MSTYCTTTSLELLLPGITFNTSTTLLAGLCIEDAEAVINHHLSQRYNVPFSTFTSTPPLVKTICSRIACHYLMKSIFTGDAQNTNNWTQGFYDQNISLLKDIQDYKKDLLNTTGSAISERGFTSTDIQCSTEYSPTFDMDTSSAWAIDQDRLDDIER